MSIGQILRLGDASSMHRKTGMTFETLIRRLTGFSTPLFGISWASTESERDIVRRLVISLEDRRVLFNPLALEVEWQAIESVTDIRRHLSEVLGEIGEASPGVDPIKAMRAACRKFLDDPHLRMSSLETMIGRPVRRKYVVPERHELVKKGDNGSLPKNAGRYESVDDSNLEYVIKSRNLERRDHSGFLVALGELRAIFGIHLASLSMQYGITLDENLTTLLPAEDDE